MSLLDIFKKKKIKKPSSAPLSGDAEGKEKKKKVVKKGKKPVEKKPSFTKVLENKEEIKIEPPRPKKKPSDKAYSILFSPHITEKATMLAKENNYVFKIRPAANKTEVKKVIEDRYGVNVIGVKIINIPAKKRRLGRQEGWRKGYKKAIVKIKKGQKIEILPR